MDESVPVVISSPGQLNQKFESAVGRSAQMTNVPNQVKLDLYAYYKQSTVGDCNSAEPSRWKMVENAKWHAWTKLKGMMETNAKQAYIELVDKHVPPQDEDEEDHNSKTKQQNETINVTEQEKNPTITIIVENSNVEKPRIIVEENGGNTHADAITLANVQVQDTNAPVDINIQAPAQQQQAPAATSNSNSATVMRSIRAMTGSNESPLPTWVVFLLGVFFLCLLDDNVTMGNVLMNSLGVSVFTAAIISLQMR